MSKFITKLDARSISDKVWELLSSLKYASDQLGLVEVPAGFQTDFASVIRVPGIYTLWGNRAHHESVIHDYLYRKDSDPVTSRHVADSVFLEAMKSRGKSFFIYYPMYLGVRFAGRPFYHNHLVGEKIVSN